MIGKLEEITRNAEVPLIRRRTQKHFLIINPSHPAFEAEAPASLWEKTLPLEAKATEPQQLAYGKRNVSAWVKETSPENAAEEIIHAIHAFNKGAPTPFPLFAIVDLAKKKGRVVYQWEPGFSFGSQALYLLPDNDYERVRTAVRETLEKSHGLGLFHGDLNPSNIRIQNIERTGKGRYAISPGKEPQVLLTDLATMRVARPASKEGRVRHQTDLNWFEAMLSQHSEDRRDFLKKLAHYKVRLR